MRLIPLENEDVQEALVMAARTLVVHSHAEAKSAGWWEGKEPHQHFPTAIALIHSEVSEALEGHRKNLMDDYLPSRPMVEVELADALIRICDLAGAMKLDLGGAIYEKLAYNRSRADHKKENRGKAGGKAY